MPKTKDEKLAQDFEYCRLLVKENDYDRYLIGLCAKREVQKYLWALFAFNHEIAKTREVVTETQLGLIRLQWWREEIDKIYDGGEVKDNQILPCLAEAITSKALSKEYFETLLYAREFDLEGVSPENLEGLCAYADYTNTPLLHLISEICDFEVGEEAVKHLGIAYGLVGLMGAIPFHAQQSRSFLPSDMVGEQSEEKIVEEVISEATRNLDICGQNRFAQPFRSIVRLIRLDIRQIKKCAFNPAHKNYIKTNYIKPLIVSF